MFFAVGTINLVLLTVLGILIVQIRRFVRDAEEYSTSRRSAILHPLLDFDQIRSIPSVRDIELLLLSIVLILISIFFALFTHEGKNLAEYYPQWWTVLEVGGILVFCHSLLRYTRHLVERDRSDWHRAYEQTHDFLLYRGAASIVVLIVVIWLALFLPSQEFPTSPELLDLYQTPLLILKGFALFAYLYVLNWVLRLRGEVVALMKVIGIFITLSGLVGLWNVGFAFESDPETWMFSLAYHLPFTMIFLSLILLLFRDNMVLLTATHRAAQIIAEEKKVMLDFLAKVASDTNLGLEQSAVKVRIRQDLDRILRLTLHFAMSQSNAKAGAIYLLDTILDSAVRPDAATQLLPRVVEGPFPPLQKIPIEYMETRVKYINELFLSEVVLLEDQPFFRDLIESNRMLYLPDTSNYPNLPQQATDFLRIHSLVAVPLAMDNRMLGLLMVINKFTEKERGWDPFTPQDASLLNAVADQAAIAILSAKMHEVIDEQERLEREIEIAKKVQESLLPKEFPDPKDYEIRSFSKAARQVGGDYFDFIWVDDNRLAIVIADVAGKGVPGALTMAMLRSALRALVPRATSARDLTLMLNDFIFDDLERGVFISLQIGVLNLPEKTIKIIRAGHEPALLFREGAESTEFLEPSGMALGLDRGALFHDTLEELPVRLQTGDLLVFYTDGLTEAMNEAGEELSIERVLQVLRGCQDLSLDGMIKRVQTEIEDFSGDMPPHDDVTMVFLKVK